MIEARSLGARLGGFALADVTFTVPAGRYGVVIGPAGSGKTTLLETVAGIIPQTSGTLRLGDTDAVRTLPEHRGIGFVYQHGFLFPHLSVRQNIAYGAASADVADEAARRIGADTLADRPVAVLSGGERQLVAIARALATRPRILLLDEPFSALDPRRRTLVRREVRSLHREWAMTVLQVTHDFAEAGMLGDVAVLLDGGKVLQAGAPEEVFRRPASPYIAEFLGAENVFSGEVRVLDDQVPEFPAAIAARGEGMPSADAAANVGQGAVMPGADAAPGSDAAMGSAAGRYRAIEFSSGPLRIHTVGDTPPGPAYAVIRAEEVVLAREAHPTSARNHYRGIVIELAVLGALTRVTVEIDGTPLVAALTTRSAQELRLSEGTEVHASFKAMAVHLC